MKPDQERVKNLLTDTVTLLCKNGLTFSKELRVEGLLGITTDSNDVFLVHINEAFGENGEHIVAIEQKDTDSIADKNADKRGLKDRGGESPHSNRSQGSNRPNTPNSPITPQRHSSPAPAIKIKQEKHDDVILVEAKTEGLSSCSRKRHNSDTNHGNDNSDMYPNLEYSMDSAQGSYNYDSMDGETPTKRRAVGSETGDDSNTGDGIGAYITGIVKNVHDKPDPSQSGWTPPAVNLGAEIAAQMAQAAMAQGDNSLAGLDGSMAGPSSWSPGQNFGTPSSQPTDTLLRNVSYSQCAPRPRKMANFDASVQLDDDRPYKCTFPGCSHAFRQRASRWKHEHFKHGRRKSRTWTLMKPPLYMYSDLGQAIDMTTGAHALESSEGPVFPTGEAVISEHKTDMGLTEEKPVFPSYEPVLDALSDPVSTLETLGDSPSTRSTGLLDPQIRAQEQSSTHQGNEEPVELDEPT